MGEDAEPRRRPARVGVDARACSPRRWPRARPTEGAKFSDYFDFGQRIKDMPSHRALAMLRGRNEGVLDLDLDVAHEAGKPHPAELKDHGPPSASPSGAAPPTRGSPRRCGWPGRRKLAASLSADLLARLKERADAEAISVFSKNLKDLLLAAPAGPRATMGLDPGFRTRRQGRGGGPDRQGGGHRRPSIRTSRGATGPARWRRWPRCA